MNDWSISVIVPAFKHEPFVIDSLEGLVRQDIFKSVKVFVGDDCSPDRTYDRAIEFAAQYPNISVARNSTNLGWTENYGSLLDKCDTEYIAVLEADDFWVTPDKLRRQIEFLRDNEKVRGCFSELHSFETGRGIYRRVSCTPNDRYALVSLLDVLDSNPPTTFSNCCFRASSLRRAFTLLRDKFFCDWLANMVISEEGGLGYIPGASMVYRIHRGGSWSGASPLARQKMLVRVLETALAVMPGRYTSFFSEKLSRLISE